MWVTELGWGSDPQVPNDLAKSPEEQAELLSETLGTMYDGREKLGPARRDLVHLARQRRQDRRLCLWCQTAGLLDPDGDSKPSWLAFTELTGGEP